MLFVATVIESFAYFINQACAHSSDIVGDGIKYRYLIRVNKSFYVIHSIIEAVMSDMKYLLLLQLKGDWRRVFSLLEE